VESDRLGHRSVGMGWGLCVDHHVEFQRPTYHPRGAFDASRAGGDLNPRVLYLSSLAEAGNNWMNLDMIGGDIRDMGLPKNG